MKQIKKEKLVIIDDGSKDNTYKKLLDFLPSEFKQFYDLRKEYSAVIGHRNYREDGFSRVFVTKTLKFV